MKEIKHTTADREVLHRKLRSLGQEHLLARWGESSPDEQKRLAREIAEVDFDLIERLVRGDGVFDPTTIPTDRLDVPEVWTINRPWPGLSREQAAGEGERLLRDGRICCLVVAGGQGTRLGFPGPKGTLPFGPVSGKTLFEIHCAKIKALEDRFGSPVPLVVMTSDANDEETRRYFELHGHFGLHEIRFMRQGTLPAVDDQGKLFLAAKDRIFKSPNGHGGTIAALADSGLLDELMARGFTDVFYFQVDNPLVKIAEPFFLGGHRLTGAEYSLKVLRKRCPEEKLGLVTKSDGQYFVVEYSDLPAELAAARDEEGELLFWAGSPAIHVFSLAFFKRLVSEQVTLPYHRARKRIPHIDAAGTTVEPEEPNGTKFETFIFDAMPHARTVLAVEGIRGDEFAPVKNAGGEDSLQTAQRMVIELHWMWLATRGLTIPRDQNESACRPCEIHPSFALGPEDIPADVAERIEKDGPVYLE